MRGGVGIFGQLLGPFFGFCTEKLRFFGLVVRCSFRFSVFFAKIKEARFLCGSLCSQMLGYLMFLNFIVNPSQTAMLSVSTDSTPRQPTDFGGNCSSILLIGPYVPKIPNKFEI